jgi:PAS domain S-box-containing protein
VVRDTNRAARATLGYAGEEMESRNLQELLHPADLHLVARAGELLAGGADRVEAEVRLRRGDGTWQWCSSVVAPVRRDEGAAHSFVVILEDIGERKRQAAWAAAVQREMLPRDAPDLEGYELAGSFIPAQEVAGDLHDWVVEDGHLELTVADVMGKGMGAALVMAALRTALRMAPGELGPAARLERAARSMTFGPRTEGLFVTLFHARLELATGCLRYVDAGHGYCAIRRAAGGLDRLGERSLPLGVDLGEGFREGRVWLEPGDMLVVCSDALVEIGDETIGFEELVDQLKGVERAGEAVERLLSTVSERLTDDATALVLRRLAPVRSGSDQALILLCSAAARGSSPGSREAEAAARSSAAAPSASRDRPPPARPAPSRSRSAPR